MRSGHELPLLLAAAFRASIDGLHEVLAVRGHPDVRPVHGFALQALGDDGATTADLGRRLGVTKQAAAKTVARLRELGYVERAPDADDARAMLVRPTARGRDCLRTSAEVFQEQHDGWVSRIGADRVAALEDDLEAFVAGTGGPRLGDLPGWMR